MVHFSAYKVKLSDNDHGSSSGDEFDTPEGDLPLQMEDSPSNSMRNKVSERISPASSLQSPSSENAAEPEEERLQLQFASSSSALEPVKQLPSPSSNVNQGQSPEVSAALAGIFELNNNSERKKKNLTKNSLKVQTSLTCNLLSNTRSTKNPKLENDKEIDENSSS